MRPKTAEFETFSLDQVCEYTGAPSTAWLCRRIVAGEVTAVRAGKQWRMTRSDMCNVVAYMRGAGVEEMAARDAVRETVPRPAPSIDALQARQYLDHIESAKRQSGIYFWAYLTSGVLGIGVLLTAAALAIFGSRDTAIFTAISDVLPSGITALFYKRAGDLERVVQDNLGRLDRAVENSKRTAAAKDAASKLPPGQDRELLLSLLAIHHLLPDASPEAIAALLAGARPRARVRGRAA
ncbi:hypothetical protein ACIP5Y_32515 [Nocardia sp. NPDC088792]|uniref:TRADD-N-associated membrane domain-containing protein n=1 Tax=Nocardia sp. NPDC088792 TaxID=3364332 RepID=UPI003819BF84